jgi:hypothetical protein
VAKPEDMTVPENDRGRDNVHPHVNRLMAFWRKMKAEGWPEHVDPFRLRCMMEDLQPVVDMYNEVAEAYENIPEDERREAM